MSQFVSSQSPQSHSCLLICCVCVAGEWRGREPVWDQNHSNRATEGGRWNVCLHGLSRGHQGNAFQHCFLPLFPVPSFSITCEVKKQSWIFCSECSFEKRGHHHPWLSTMLLGGWQVGDYTHLLAKNSSHVSAPCDEFCCCLFDCFLHLGVWGCFQLVAEGLHHFHMLWKQDCIISICYESRIASFPFAIKAGLHHFHLPWKQDWIIPICRKRIMTAFFRYTYSSEQKCKYRLFTDSDVKGYHVSCSFELHDMLE